MDAGGLRDPEFPGEEPWKFVVNRPMDGKDRYVALTHLTCAAMLIFACDRLGVERSLPPFTYETATKLLIKSQKADGGWRCWEDDTKSDVESTAMIIHALAIHKPRGWATATKKAAKWLWTNQHKELGYWSDAGSPDDVYLTVLVLDAIALAEGTTSTFDPARLPPNSSRAISRSLFHYDGFICHASEDKAAFVRPLANALSKLGLHIWFDEFELKVGDSLRRSIDKGLAKSAYGIVVLSKSFFSKGWSQRELDGLVARDVDSPGTILPIWHGIGREEVARSSLLR